MRQNVTCGTVVAKQREQTDAALNARSWEFEAQFVDAFSKQKFWKFEERITGQNIIPLKGKWLPNEAQFRLNAIHFSEVENLRIITCNRVFIWNTFNHFCGSSQFQGAPSPQKRTLFNIYKKFWGAFLCVCAHCAHCVCVCTVRMRCLHVAWLELPIAEIHCPRLNMMRPYWFYRGGFVFVITKK